MIIKYMNPNPSLSLCQESTGIDLKTNECIDRTGIPNVCSCVETQTPGVYHLIYNITAETRLSKETVRLIWLGESTNLTSEVFTFPEIKGRHGILI